MPTTDIFISISFRKYLLIGISIFAGGCSTQQVKSVESNFVRIQLQSWDQKTDINAHLYLPKNIDVKNPAVILAHGKTGLWKDSKAQVLHYRENYWKNWFLEKGFIVLLVDSFTTRGFSEGLPISEYKDRPQSVNETIVRPLDFYAALAFLKDRTDVGSIYLVGWSHGGTATLAAMSKNSSLGTMKNEHQFDGAIAFYPRCKTDFAKSDYEPYANILIFSAKEDNQVNSKDCVNLARRSKSGKVNFKLYSGATHNFDGDTESANEANQKAIEDAKIKIEEFVARMK